MSLFKNTFLSIHAFPPSPWWHNLSRSINFNNLWITRHIKPSKPRGVRSVLKRVSITLIVNNQWCDSFSRLNQDQLLFVPAPSETPNYGEQASQHPLYASTASVAPIEVVSISTWAWIIFVPPLLPVKTRCATGRLGSEHDFHFPSIPGNVKALSENV